MEMLLIMIPIFITCLGIYLLFNKHFVLGLVVLLFSFFSAISLIVVESAILENEIKNEIIETFENGNYSLKFQKCLEIYNDDNDEELQKVLVALSNSEDKNIQIQKCCKKHFVVTITGIHYVLSDDIMEELIKQEVLTYIS